MPTIAERSRVVGSGEGGDETTAIDLAAEQVIVARLEATGESFVLVSEELGEQRFGGPSEVRVVVDPIDGSLNAKRGIPFFSLSIARATGPAMGDVELAYVYDFGSGEEWTAERGRGAFLDGRPLAGPPPREEIELLAFEATRTDLVAERAAAMVGVAYRLRIMGSLALSLCHLADGRLDAVCSLKPARSVDIAAGQLLVRERGYAIELPEAPPFEARAARRARPLPRRRRGHGRDARPALGRVVRLTPVGSLQPRRVRRMLTRERRSLRAREEASAMRKRRLVVLLVLSGVLVLFPAASASSTPNPSSVTIVGDLQSEAGCAGDWDPACAATHLTYDANDDVWQGTFALPAGNYQYKAALNDSWDENYGLHAVPGGDNIPLSLALRRERQVLLRPQEPLGHRQPELDDRHGGRRLPVRARLLGRLGSGLPALVAAGRQRRRDLHVRDHGAAGGLVPGKGRDQRVLGRELRRGRRARAARTSRSPSRPTTRRSPSATSPRRTS